MRPALRLGDTHLLEEECRVPGSRPHQRWHHQPESRVANRLAARPHPALNPGAAAGFNEGLRRAFMPQRRPENRRECNKRRSRDQPQRRARGSRQTSAPSPPSRHGRWDPGTVAAFRNTPGPIDFSGPMPSRGEAQKGSDILSSSEPRGVIDQRNKLNATTEPTPGMVIKRWATGCFAAFSFTARSRSPAASQVRLHGTVAIHR